MSVSISVNAVWGFRAEVEDVMGSETKYREDDGTPYERPVKQGETLSVSDIEGKPIIVKEATNICYGEDEEVDGLELYQSIEDVLGICVADTGDLMYGGEETFHIDTNPPLKVIEFAKKHRIDPELFMISSVG